ncbi:MAG: hypothetical protein KDD45_15415, partial [Bdellovibrionales bacterium]|nr:hypothetical protein [Bdellovibrionales bacterium]
PGLATRLMNNFNFTRQSLTRDREKTLCHYWGHDYNILSYLATRTTLELECQRILDLGEFETKNIYFYNSENRKHLLADYSTNTFYTYSSYTDRNGKELNEISQFDVSSDSLTSIKIYKPFADTQPPNLFTTTLNGEDFIYEGYGNMYFLHLRDNFYGKVNLTDKHWKDLREKGYRFKGTRTNRDFHHFNGFLEDNVTNPNGKEVILLHQFLAEGSGSEVTIDVEKMPPGIRPQDLDYFYCPDKNMCLFTYRHDLDEKCTNPSGEEKLFNWSLMSLNLKDNSWGRIKEYKNLCNSYNSSSSDYDVIKYQIQPKPFRYNGKVYYAEVEATVDGATQTREKLLVAYDKSKQTFSVDKKPEFNPLFGSSFYLKNISGAMKAYFYEVYDETGKIAVCRATNSINTTHSFATLKENSAYFYDEVRKILYSRGEGQRFENGYNQGFSVAQCK